MSELRELPSNPENPADLLLKQTIARLDANHEAFKLMKVVIAAPPNSASKSAKV